MAGWKGLPFSIPTVWQHLSAPAGNVYSEKLMRKFRGSVWVTVFAPVAGLLAHASSYQYFRIGNKINIKSSPAAGVALMGGGKDLDDASRWLCQKGNGGDFLILRADGDDAYNSYLNGLCKLNSVSTIAIADHQGARDPEVAEIIRSAAVICYFWWRSGALHPRLERNACARGAQRDDCGW